MLEMGYVGSGALNRARRFSEKYLGELASLYGINAVKQFRDIAPQMAVSIERVLDKYANKTLRNAARGKGGTKGIIWRGFETSGGADSISEKERTAWKGSEPAENAAEQTSSPEALKPRWNGPYLSSGKPPLFLFCLFRCEHLLTVKPDSRKDTKSLPVYINLVKYVQTLKWKREVYGSHQQQTKAQTLCPGRS